MMSNCVSSGNAGQALPPKLCRSYTVNALNKHILISGSKKKKTKPVLF